jgi:hypothetical protein
MSRLGLSASTAVTEDTNSTNSTKTEAIFIETKSKTMLKPFFNADVAQE